MNVRLIAYTPQPIRTVAQAAWICTHQGFPEERDLHPDRSGPFVRRVLASGHDGILEAAVFSFAIAGITRACSHQLVRCRIASFAQQSQRYVVISKDVSEDNYVIPDAIKESDFLERYAKHMLATKQLYLDMVDGGIKPEDARSILPNAMATKMVMTMNARELHHFFSLRCCSRAQKEIRDLANEMLKLCKQVAPILFENCGPECLRTGCPEGVRSCGGLL